MSTTKPRASDDGVLYLIQKRRKEAKEAMYQVVQRFLKFPVRIPSITFLIDYLSDMVSCIELSLKLLSGNWGSHDVAGMYRDIFGMDYAKSDLMDRLERAIKDQKYLIEPASGIDAKIPEMEELFESLSELLKDRFGSYTVEIDHELTRSVCEFIRDRAGVFYHRHAKPEEDFVSCAAAYRAEVAQIQSNMDLILNRDGTLPFRIGLVSSV